MGPVVGGEHEDGVFGDTVFFEAVEEPPDIPIEQGDHRRVGSLGLGPVLVGVDSQARNLHSLIACFVVGVRDGEWQVEEEAPVLVAVNKREGLRCHEVMGVGHLPGRDSRAFRPGGLHDIALDLDLFLVPEEELRVVIVSMALVEVAEPVVETLAVGNAGGAWFTEAPLAYDPGGVALLL